MKRLFITFATACALLAAPMAYAAPVASGAAVEAEPDATDFVDFSFNGYSFSIPQGLPVDMQGSEALVKSADGSFGLSIKVEKDSKATPQGAYGLCQRVVTDLHLQQVTLTKVSVHGLEGACVDGTLEGKRVAVEILASGHQYVKVIAIFDDAHSSDVRTVVESVRKN